MHGRPAPLFRRLIENPWVWLAPVLVPFTLMLLVPIVEVVRLSFYRWDWLSAEWVGSGQYRRLAVDPDFWRALWHTVLFAAVVVPVWIVATLLIASAIQPMAERVRRGWMTAYYMTYLVAPVVLAIVWSWMLAPGSGGLLGGEGGLLNRLLGTVGLGPVPWLIDARWALASVIISTALTIPGSGVVIYAAAIGAVPAELHEAAHLEGAGTWRRWWHVTVPLVRPTTLYLSVIYTIASFQVFERVYIMTGGGPGGATTVLVEQIYTRAFLDFDFGAAAAQSVVLMVLIVAIAWAQFRSLRSDVQY